MEPDDTETHNDLGFEPRSRSGPTNSGFLSEDQLPVTKHTSMVNTVALKDYRVDASDVVGGLNPVDEQQPGIAACTEFRMSTKQLGSSFGCIPLTPMLLYQGSHKAWQEVPGILQAHRMIRDSGHYFDKQLCDLIEFGFPLDFDRSRHLESTLVNHASARNFSDHIDKYLQEELEFEAILGPFDHPPIQMHISPFMTMEKSGSDSRRAIIDLSFPKGSSVNDGVAKNFYLGTEFQMHYPSVDSIIRTLKNLGPSAKIFKVDISRAFRQLKVDPGDIDLLGLQHRDQLYLDLSVPFGYRLGSFFFSKISDSIRFIMAKNGHNALLNYIDDLIYCGLLSNINQSYEFLLNLLQDLGLDISYKKLCPPDTKVICLGILFNTVDRTISIPTDKLSEIVKVCDDWSDKKTVTKNQLQSLLGLLLYISKCVKPARFFLNRMLQLLRDNFENDSIVLTSEFFRDLLWFQTFLKSYNGITIYDIRPLNIRIYLDACLQGLGGCYDNFVYTIPIPKGFNGYNIVHLEMLNVVVALKVWAASWANKYVHIYCDNHAVVDVLTYGNTRDHMLATAARNIWLITAMFNIDLVVSHIKGADNRVADLLSRWHLTVDNATKLSKLVQSPIWIDTHIDLTLLNHDI